MGKLWALLFGITMFACLGLFLISPLTNHWWLQPRVSTNAWPIDELFYIILYITGFFFILTEGLLVFFMFRYASQADGKPPVFSGPSAFTKFLQGPSPIAGLFRWVAGYFNEPHKIELAWTIVPAAILLYIAFAQVGTWANVKYQSRYASFVEGKIPVVTEISARQFEWRIRYPSVKRMSEFLKMKQLDEKEIARLKELAEKTGPEGEAAKKQLQNNNDFNTFAKFVQFDDVYTVNELHAIKNHPSLVHLSTRDVIHSFNMPHLRIKQDALPGKVIPVWFTPIKSNAKVIKKGAEERWVDEPVWDIACAELCGWGHYRMDGRLIVHETEKDFLHWLQQKEDEQNMGKTKPRSETEKK